MGCDIHLYREKRFADRWTSADPWEAYDYGQGDAGLRVPYESRAYTGRDYQLFGILSRGVRTEHPFSSALRGMPLDASPEVLADCERWGADGHSHSYLYLHELVDLRHYLQDKTIPIEGMKDPEELAALQSSIASGKPDWNLIYPFCSWTTRKEAVPFKVDVPALWYLTGLDKIISSFEDVPGDLHRVVFWFDN